MPRRMLVWLAVAAFALAAVALGFARAIFEEWGLTPQLTPITTADWERTKPETAKRPEYSVLDLVPLENTLGRPMRPWRDALRGYHDQYGRS